MLLFFTLLLACSPAPSDEWAFPPDQAGPPGRVRWDTPMWSHNPVDIDRFRETIRFTLQTRRWGYQPELFFVDNRFTRDYSERHTMSEIASSPQAGGFTRFELALERGPFPNIPDQTTIWNVESFHPAAPTYSVLVAALVRDAAGRPADCILFGYDPAGLYNPPPAVPLPAWLDPRYCRDANP